MIYTSIKDSTANQFSKKRLQQIVLRGKLVDIVNSYRITDGNGLGASVALYNEVANLFGIEEK